MKSVGPALRELVDCRVRQGDGVTGACSGSTPSNGASWKMSVCEKVERR